MGYYKIILTQLHPSKQHLYSFLKWKKLLKLGKEMKFCCFCDCLCKIRNNKPQTNFRHWNLLSRAKLEFSKQFNQIQCISLKMDDTLRFYYIKDLSRNVIILTKLPENLSAFVIIESI